MEKEFRSYNVKMVETPTTIEVWEYIDEAVFYSVKLDTKSKCEDEKIIDNQTNIETNVANKEYDALKRKQKHYDEMRWVVARIVDCNFDDNTKFMTLTFKENIQDITYTNYEFNKFIKRLNFYLYHEKKKKLQYPTVQTARNTAAGSKSFWRRKLSVRCGLSKKTGWSCRRG